MARAHLRILDLRMERLPRATSFLGECEGGVVDYTVNRRWLR